MSTAAASLGLQTSTPAPISKQPLWRNLGFQVIIAMILGAAVGFLFPSLAIELEILGDIFLRLIKTAVAPLVFLCVAAGIVSAGDFKRVGKVGLVAMIYFEIVSTIALAFGLVAGNLLGVGKGIATATAGAGVKPPAAPGKPQGALDFILNILSGKFGTFRRRLIA